MLSSKDWQSRDCHTAALLPYWYNQRNLTSYCKSTWEFYFVKNKNSLAPRWHDKFLPEPYAFWHFWKAFTYAYACWHLWKAFTYATCSCIKRCQIICDPCEIHFILLRLRSRMLGILTMWINLQAHGYRLSFHPWVFKGIVSTGNVCALTSNSAGLRTHQG